VLRFAEMMHRPEPGFKVCWKNTFLGEQDFCFYDMFKRNFPRHDTVWGAQKRFGGYFPQMPPVATGLNELIIDF